VQVGDWQAAAEWLNAFKREDIQSRLAQLTSDQVANLHQGAIDNPRVGKDSQVAQMTAPGTPSASNEPTSPSSASDSPTPASPPGQQQATDPGQEEVRMRSLARRPSEALKNWQSLSPAGRSFVIMVMTNLYGPDFALEFTQYANGKKKPDFSTDVTQDDPKSLIARGFRHAGDFGGIPLWVHPSGHEVMVLSGGTPTPSQPPPERPPEEVERCERTCDDVDDEDACSQCCEDRIPETDQPCRTNCKFRCEVKL